MVALDLGFQLSDFLQQVGNHPTLVLAQTGCQLVPFALQLGQFSHQVVDQKLLFLLVLERQLLLVRLQLLNAFKQPLI
jgi:hypothetical protein